MRCVHAARGWRKCGEKMNGYENKRKTAAEMWRSSLAMTGRSGQGRAREAFVNRQGPGTVGHQHQVAASHGKVLEEHDLLHGVNGCVIQEGGHDRKGSQGKRHKPGLEADQQGKACDDFEQDGGSGQEGRQAARGEIARETLDIAELAEARDDEDERQQDTAGGMCVSLKCGHGIVSLRL